jgi:hypothetical protein
MHMRFKSGLLVLLALTLAGCQSFGFNQAATMLTQVVQAVSTPTGSQHQAAHGANSASVSQALKAVDAVATFRNSKAGFLRKHAALTTDLNAVETTAMAVIRQGGKTNVATSRQFTDMLDMAVKRADRISKRSSESWGAKWDAGEVRNRLASVRG